MAVIHQRPGAVTFVAILLFIFGAMAVISSASNGIYATFLLMDPKPFDPKEKLNAQDPMDNIRFLAHEIPGFCPTVIAVAALDVLFAVAQLVCAIGLMRLRPSARTLTMGLILIRLVYSLGYDGFAVLVFMPAQFRFYELHPLEMPPEAMDMFATVTKGVTLGAFGCGVFMQFFVAGLIILVLRSATVKAAFAGTPAAPREEQKPAPPPLYAGYEDEEGGNASPR